ncbi:MAG: DUF2637 domain-containing protein [Bifidobacteriaceae bacterium]|jgi:hypothetical protein|nr:DUF2637 domain-containing protein [Bifidobacteriaceae bacterium]
MAISGSDRNGRFATALWPGIVLSSFLAILGFTLSFLALRDVGLAWGVPLEVSWAFPLLIDGFIVLATWVAWRFRTDGLRATWYPWSALIVFSVLSVVGNAMHAYPRPVGNLTLEPWQAAAFSSIPPIALLVASHMLVVIATRGARRPAHAADTPAGDPPGGGRALDAEAPAWLFDDLLPAMAASAPDVTPTTVRAPLEPAVPVAVATEPSVENGDTPSRSPRMVSSEPARDVTQGGGDVGREATGWASDIARMPEGTGSVAGITDGDRSDQAQAPRPKRVAKLEPTPLVSPPRLRLVEPIKPRGVVDGVPDEFVAWCAERVAQGQRIVHAEAHRAFPSLGSISTVRRRVGELTGPDGLLASAEAATNWLAPIASQQPQRALPGGVR